MLNAYVYYKNSVGSLHYNCMKFQDLFKVILCLYKYNSIVRSKKQTKKLQITIIYKSYHGIMIFFTSLI